MGMGAGSFLALSKVFPRAFAVNDTTNVLTFNTANAASYTFDASLMTVDNSGARPISAVNKFANAAFTSDVSSWTIGAVQSAGTPAGWVIVPGNSLYGTSDFLMMKYEARCAPISDPTHALEWPSSGWWTYVDTMTACTSANNYQVVSVPSGYSISNVDLSTAQARCNSVSVAGGTAHLTTRREWMTTARNIEAQNANWSLGSVGNGYIFAGHNDNDPSRALPVSALDTGDNACAYTDTSGTNPAPSPCPSNTARGTSHVSQNQKRVLQLSNGFYLWDLSGNLHEWTSDLIQGKDMPTGVTPGFAWRQPTDITSYGTLSYDLVRSINSALYASDGVGQIYSDGSPSNTTSYGTLWGGSFESDYTAGLFTQNFSNQPTGMDRSIGFRCTSDPVVSQSFSSGTDAVTATSVVDAKIVQSLNVGNTANYDLSINVYDNTSGNVGGTISSAVAQLYYHGATISTTYTNLGSGWWKLSGTVVGANESREYGILVKSSKNVSLDNATLSLSGSYTVYTTAAYSNSLVTTWDSFCDGTLSGNVCVSDMTTPGRSSVKYQLCTNDGSTCESGNTWKYWNGSTWASATDLTTTVNTAAELTQSAMQALPVSSHKLSIKAIFSFEGVDLPALNHITIGLTSDVTPPSTNASSLTMKRASGGTSVVSGGWTNQIAPEFSWSSGGDNLGGSGLKGYCLYLGLDSNDDGLPDGDPATSKGMLGTSPASTTGSTCQFITNGTTLDLATASYRGSPWLVSSSHAYILAIKAVDNAGNVFGGSSALFSFHYDNSAPSNVGYISCASGSFSNVSDMSFNWPTAGVAAAQDVNAGVYGWQYQLNSTSGTWLGSTTDSILGLVNYIPNSQSSYTLSPSQDGSSVVSGTNIVYFRSVDAAGNVSGDGTIRTCSLSYGASAPSFSGIDAVTVTPGTSTTNSYALSWPAATAAVGNTVAHYYYMVNTLPPATLATIQGNSATYIDNGTSRIVNAANLPGVNKGSNTVYVVATDNASTPNYSASNYISGSFTLNSTDPDNVGNLVSTDSSIKSQSQWNVTLTWTAPTYKGAGGLSYQIYRSTDGNTFTQVGSTSGLSYVDNTPSSTQYYYKIYTKDGANARSSGSNAVSITPTGKWTSAPSLDSQPTATNITTKKATINWSTSRGSDSKIAFGTESGKYSSDEVSNSSQVSSHSVNLTNLKAGTTYFYKAKWTDEDGNTGESEEKQFTTTSAPTVKDVAAKNIGLTTAIIQFTANNASKVRIYYGNTTAFGAFQEISTSTLETTYTAQLSGLLDGVKYYYKINTFDAESAEYEGTILDLQTLPKPRVTNVKLDEVKNTAQTTVLVAWTTNTEVSSIVTFAPESNPAGSRDEIKLALEKGPHTMTIKGLLPNTTYLLTVRGRDKIGNEAASDPQRFTTATDTRPPAILNLKVMAGATSVSAVSAQDVKVQLLVSWDTDEPASSQVEFGEGTGASYGSKSQEDGNLTMNHLVILSNLTPSMVYHLRALSHDGAGNLAQSIDTVTIAPKAVKSALDLVVKNLSQAFNLWNLKP